MSKLFAIILIFSVSACTQNLEKPTHTLELLTPDAKEPVATNVVIHLENNTKKISIEFPDGVISTNFITPADSTMKFQLAQIKKNMLVDIQFIGSGNLYENVEGEFNAYLDFTHREDMSGKFKILPLNQSDNK